MKGVGNVHDVRIFVADLDYNHNLYSTRRDWYRAYADASCRILTYPDVS